MSRVEEYFFKQNSPSILNLEIDRIDCQENVFVKEAPRMKVEMAKRYIEEAFKLGFKHIVLNGNIISNYQGIYELVELIKLKDMNPVVLIQEEDCEVEILKNFCEAGAKQIFVTMIDYKKEECEKLENINQYSQLVEYSKIHGVETGINLVIKSDNLNDFPDLVETAKICGVSKISAFLLKPDLNDSALNFLDRKKFSKLNTYLKSFRTTELKIDMESCYSSITNCILKKAPQQFGGGCLGGKEIISVDGNGVFRPCRFWKTGKKYDSIEEYIKNSKDIGKTDKKEIIPLEPCRRCEYFMCSK